VRPLLCTLIALTLSMQPPNSRPRARDLGIAPGALTPGALNAITDVDGVRVGQVTIRTGDTVRTGVTAILPHAGNLFQEKVAGAVFVGNAFGKLAGSTQVQELGTIETPIVLTNTLSVGTAVDAVVRWTTAQAGNENVRSVNALVGETNDGTLNDIRGQHVTREHVTAAITGAKGGPVDEGSIGAGTGTIAFGWKGGIGTSSRMVKQGNDTWTVGVLVQTNYGGKLVIDGVPVWRELTPRRGDQGRVPESADPRFPVFPISPFPDSRSPDHPITRSPDSLSPDHPISGSPDSRSPDRPITRSPDSRSPDRPITRSSDADGSCMIVVATDAPLDAKALQRLAARAIFALARTGSTYSNGSGDFAIAFSTHPSQRVTGSAGPQARTVIPTDGVSGLFEAVLDATEEAVDNSLLKATDTTANGRTIAAIPIDALTALLKKYGRGPR
jgi:D-aminopeptidase